MGFFDFFKPKWMNEDEGKAMKHVREISDEKTLKKIAVKSTHWRVRRVAVGKLTDQFLLVNIAQSDSNSDVRKTATGKLEKLEKRMDSDAEEKEMKKFNFKKQLRISGIVVVVFVLLLLPYVITRNEGFPKLLAQLPMFVFLLLVYISGIIGGVIGFVLGIGFLTVGLSNAISGKDYGKEAAEKGLVIAIICVIVYFVFSAILVSLGYVNPFTGELFVPLH